LPHAVAIRATLSTTVLAYVFWHRPVAGVDPAAYDAALTAFHDALARPGSVTFQLAHPPWKDDGRSIYEDWYPVTDWTDVGRLEHEAVTGPRRAPHDVAAHWARWGTGSVVGAVRLAGPIRDMRSAAWFDKPEGMTDERFYAELDDALTAAPDHAVWQRRLVLGPQPEFVVLSAGPVALPWRAVRTEPRRAAP
jgi:hypothetical protein